MSVASPQLASGFLMALPAADRQAVLVPVGAVGIDTDPAGPSTVLSWNGWLNSTVPAAKALGADTAVATAAVLITSMTATARDTIRSTRREKGIHRLLLRVASLALRRAAAFRRRGRGGQATA